eukprot:8008036-Alexandrium_andersonii.AAC.1
MRHERPSKVPPEVRGELLLAAYLAPVIFADLGLGWAKQVHMFDASEIGGAVIASEAENSELRREA